ncbi:MAG: GTP pyrophosphokinase [Alkalibacterium gilvum]|uniref:Putative GTP pyrophosphokinase n=1 Tax=Alkalibacterium gilvum TaxID=1130080 RepID=A0A1H6TCK4_9LACT|nr:MULTISPECIES: GTP pyrophosphokinase family protein [Alkalibacterium]MDN6293153.1 GTP pyrophosphokinase family protein [Alkalibacterium sp.]MDN6294943.1 GTP pyrophosphokinase family protein [Alkalibacterium sp.]MDN6398316.1 GTP pyrophosphokinase family protein [Alkalibacterium sp.]MDN6729594.1 GTP pyrophosphokinase family protein [Alkalibacterium sp.]SEI77758.1 putative GTP pyrophosphokinase [Alkalibacterium gilvum]
MNRDWELFLLPYKQTVDELKVKLRGLREMYHLRKEHGPIEFVTGRVKPIKSIIMKSKTRDIPIDKLEKDMEDLAGVRIMCPFVEDIHEVVSLLKNRNDLTVIYEKDYVTNKKDSGYRSYHLICEYPVQLIDQVKIVLVEVQIRTLAMNFWASIEHSLNYKYQGEFPEEINARLQKAAESAFQLDEEMSTIREEIKEIQQDFRFRED